MISTRTLSSIPTIPGLKLLTQSLAMLDAIIEPQWSMRYYSFNAHWDGGESMASMRNGSGDHFFLLFHLNGAILKGFAHESAMSPYSHQPPQMWPGVLTQVPDDFATFVSEPAFEMGDTTFCVWRTFRDKEWQRGEIDFPTDNDPDGSAEMLAILDSNPRTYHRWAEEYFERRINLDAVADIYAHGPLTEELVKELNSTLSLQDVQGDQLEIGY